jgi:hypothetical protein
MILHYTGDMDNAHYICVKKLSNGDWVKLDDLKHAPLNERELLDLTRTGYVYFYVRKVSLEVCAPCITRKTLNSLSRSVIISLFPLQDRR